MRFKTVEADVIRLLRNNKATRCNDMYLYFAYVRDKGLTEITSVFTSEYYRILHGVAPYETVSRVRRKLQERYPELKPTKAQIERKKKTEQEFKLYAKGGK